MEKLKKELLGEIKELIDCDKSLKIWGELIEKTSHNCQCGEECKCKGGCSCGTKAE